MFGNKSVMRFPKFIRIAAIAEKVQAVPTNEGTMVKKIVLHPFEAELIGTITRALGVSYELVMPEDGQHGSLLPNGTWTGIIGLMKRGEADLTLSFNSITEDIWKEFHLMIPQSPQDVTFVTKHEYSPDIRAFIQPFQKTAWFSVVACVFIMSFLFRYLMRKKYSPVTLLTSTVCSLLHQGIKLEPQRIGEYFLMASWLLGSSLLSYFYAAVLLSFVAFPTLRGIKTVEDLADGIKAGTHQCSTLSYFNVASNLLSSNDSKRQIIGENLQHGEDTFDAVEVLEHYKGGKKPVYIIYRKFLLHYPAYYFISEDSLFSVTTGAPVPKNFCCMEELARVNSRLRESGFYLKLETDLIFQRNLETLNKMTKFKESNGNSENQLSTSAFTGPFYFLIASHVFSFIVFLIELCVGNWKKKKRLLLKNKISQVLETEK